MGKLLSTLFGGPGLTPPPAAAAHNDGPRSIKIVIVGATTVGKTCLITNFMNNTFTDVQVPNVLDVYRG